MRILLDECVDRRLSKHLQPFFVRTVPEMGWATIKNGALLKLAERDFDVLITVDRNLAFQQTIPNFALAVIVLVARTNRLADLLPLMPKLCEVVPLAPKGEVTRVSL